VFDLDKQRDYRPQVKIVGETGLGNRDR